ncbi:MAG: hypothetical protein ACW97Z_09995 [Candidatus Hodarchaeales archaeon]|jgi:hypothetical protein
MSTSDDYQGILVYSEFDDKVGPVVRAHYPETLYPDELKLLASMSMPNVGQQTSLDIAESTGFHVFQISESKVVCSYYKFLRGNIKTLTGASLVSISFVTERLINPFRFKPFLELVLTPMFRVVVDSKVLRQIVDAVTSTGMIDKEITARGPSVRVKARIIQDIELPMFYYELEKDLGKI